MISLTDLLFSGVKLTKIERAVLEYLLENVDGVVSKEQLLTDVWGYAANTKTRTVSSTMERVRKKLAEVDVQIQTVWGKGFAVDTSGYNGETLRAGLQSIVDEDPEKWSRIYLGLDHEPIFENLTRVVSSETVFATLGELLPSENLKALATDQIDSLAPLDLLSDSDRELLSKVAKHLPLEHAHLSIVRRHIGASLTAAEVVELLETATSASDDAEALRLTLIGLSEEFQGGDSRPWFAQTRKYLSGLDPDSRADLLRVQGWCLVSSHRYEEAAEVYNEACELASSPIEIAHSKFALATLFLDLRDAKAYEIFSDASALYAELGDDDMVSLCDVKLSMLDTFLSDFESAQDRLSQFALANLPVQLHIDFLYTQAMIYLRIDPSRCSRWLGLTQPGLGAGQVEMRDFLAALSRGTRSEDWTTLASSDPRPGWGYLRAMVAALALQQWPEFEMSGPVEDLFLELREAQSNGETIIDLFFRMTPLPLTFFSS